MAWLLKLHDVSEMIMFMRASLYQVAMFRQQIEIQSIMSARKGKTAGIKIRDTRRSTNRRVIPECIVDMLLSKRIHNELIPCTKIRRSPAWSFKNHNIIYIYGVCIRDTRSTNIRVMPGCIVDLLSCFMGPAFFSSLAGGYVG